MYIVKSTALTTGTSGEYLAASVLQRHFKAIAFPNLPTPYDLILEAYDGRFLKCQVKTCDIINTINGCRYWKFNTGKSKKQYTADEVDFFALVSLPRRLIFCMSFDEIGAIHTTRLRETQFTERAETESINKVLGDYL